MKGLRYGFIFVWFVSCHVVAMTPSKEQIEQFKKLPKSEQEALIKQQGLDPSVLGVSGATKQIPQAVISTVKPIKSAIPDNTPSSKPSGLKRFGSSLFAGQPTTFAPVNDIPVPTDYLLGPGDQLNIEVYGNKNDSMSLVVDRNGRISIPDIGPVNVAGQTLSQAKSLLGKKIANLGMGVRSNITLGELRSFRIFVLGETKTPGSYLVSGMATMTHALYVSGGISEIGSYRNVQLKRRGKLIQTLDLYDLLLKGDTSKDVRLQPGDTLFIPSAKTLVSVGGGVRRSAIFELKNESTLSQVLKLAGGFSEKAYPSLINLIRVNQQGSQELIPINYSNKKASTRKVLAGDSIQVSKVDALVKNQVNVMGEVYRTGVRAWRQGMTINDVFKTIDSFKPTADLKYILIKRVSKETNQTELLSVNWLFQNGKSFLLNPRDEIHVLAKENSKERDRIVKPLVEELKLQASYPYPAPVVSVTGQVRFGGHYPLTKEMTVSDLIVSSGGLKPSAMLQMAEVIRYKTINGVKREVESINFNLLAALQGDAKHNIKLFPDDVLNIKQISDWSDSSRVVQLDGEVVFPGSYTIKPGETLGDVIKRAGGFTQWAEPKNAVFLREALKQQEERERLKLAAEMEKNLLVAMRRDAGLYQGAGDQVTGILTMGQTLIERVRTTPSLGRLVIGLSKENQSRYDATMNMELRDGDRLVVPKRSNEVLITGEVARSTSVIYEKDKTVEDYLEWGGGLTKRSDADSIYVVHGDGSIEKYSTDSWFASDNNIMILPGDTIVVPTDVDSISPYITWTSVSKILANFAVTAATLKTVGVIN